MPSEQRGKRILGDHVQKGKRFIPPMLQSGEFHDMPWIERILPEFVWIALLIRKYGLERAAKLLLILSRTTLKMWTETSRPWMAATSSYRLLSVEQQTALRQILFDSCYLDEFSEPLSPLLSLYPECPLSAIFSVDHSTVSNNPSNSVDSMKEVVLEMMDKRSHLATFSQAHAIYVAFNSDLLKVAKGLSLSRFPEIQDYPQSEKSKEIAASVRNTVIVLAGTKLTDVSWPQYFWNRGLKIENCYIEEVRNG